MNTHTKMTIKPWWRSKTVWINVLAATFLVATDNLPVLQGLLPEAMYKRAIFALPIINLWLRVVSSKGLSFKPQLPDGQEEKHDA